MALRDYTTEVLGSKASLRVLKTLLRYRGKIFTIRELARTAGISHPETSKVVRELEKRGIVNLQPVGRAHQVSLNEKSYILKSVVEPVFRAEKSTVSSLISTIKPYFKDKRISSVAIFGSVARGLEKDTSDIDLLVIADDREFANERISRASLAAVSKFGFALSPLIMNRTRFIRERNKDLEKSILESYTTVCGKDLREVVKDGKVAR
ncbi:MAG: nucleotidyltransferase domain-containing protein [Nitrososphaerales archaeon]